MRKMRIFQKIKEWIKMRREFSPSTHCLAYFARPSMHTGGLFAHHPFCSIDINDKHWLHDWKYLTPSKEKKLQAMPENEREQHKRPALLPGWTLAIPIHTWTSQFAVFHCIHNIYAPFASHNPSTENFSGRTFPLESAQGHQHSSIPILIFLQIIFFLGGRNRTDSNSSLASAQNFWRRDHSTNVHKRGHRDPI